MRKMLLTTLSLLAACCGAAAQGTLPFPSVRTLLNAADELVVSGDFSIEGIVLADAKDPNLSLTTQAHFSYVQDHTGRENYLSSPDGRYGFRLVFNHTADAASLHRGDRLRINLGGTTLVRDEAGACSITGLSASHIEAVHPGSAADVPVKVKAVGALTPDDYNTWVTLPDCELVFKDGALSNVYETYAMPTSLNKAASPNGFMDPWASLLCDRAGGLVYMVINTKCRWRRDGRTAPQGSGAVSGVLVHPPLTRYDVGPWQLRPLCREDIAIAPSPAPGGWQTAALWTWSDNAAEVTTDRGRRKSLGNEAVLADEGQGSLRVETRGTIYRGLDMNNPRIEKAPARYGVRGKMDRGALSVDAEASAWWNWEEDRGNGVVLHTSLENATGDRLLFAVAFAAGKIHVSSSYAYPSWWGVEYSTDGRSWTRVPDAAFRLRSYPWWYDNEVDGSRYITSYEAGLGATEHAVLLPSELLGQKDVWIRFAPAGRIVSSLAASGQDQILLQRNMREKPTVNFCSFAIRYR